MLGHIRYPGQRDRLSGCRLHLSLGIRDRKIVTRYQQETIQRLALAIRAKQSGTSSLFLSMYECFPALVWSEAVRENLLTEEEYQGCMLVLKNYRKLQAFAAIEDADHLE